MVERLAPSSPSSPPGAGGRPTELLTLGVNGAGLKTNSVERERMKVATGGSLVEPPSSISVYTSSVGVDMTSQERESPRQRAPHSALDTLRTGAMPMCGDESGTHELRGAAVDVSTASPSNSMITNKRSTSSSSSQMRSVAQTPHVRQTHNWDCGLACALMTLRALCHPSHGIQVVRGGVGGGKHMDVDGRSMSNRESNHHSQKIPLPIAIPRTHKVHKADLATMRHLCPTTSVWTIDIAHLLNHFNVVDVVFYTITLGANPDFKKEVFYKDTLGDDSNRVNYLFQTATDKGILIEKRSISSFDMKRWAASSIWLLILLVDKRKLKVSLEHETVRNSKNKNKTSGIINRVFGQFEEQGIGHRNPNALNPNANPNNGYTGHYVVVCGYDFNNDFFEIRDPAVGEKNLFISSADLEKARKEFGTDEDMLLVRRSRS